MLWFGSSWKEHEHSIRLAWFAVWCMLQNVFDAFQVSLLMSAQAAFLWIPAGIHWFLCPCSRSLDVLKGICFSNACRDSLVFMLVGPQSFSLYQWLGSQSVCFRRVCLPKIPHIFRIYSAYNPHISPPDFDRWPIRTTEWFLWTSWSVHRSSLVLVSPLGLISVSCKAFV